MAEKGGHKHFMHKEIHEQPRALADTLRGRVLLSEGDVHFEGWTLGARAGPRAARGSTILACGTTWHSGLAGKAMIESAGAHSGGRRAGVASSATATRSSSQTHLAVAITQSGETLDTLAALREAKARGARTLALCNVVGSAMTREADFTVLTNAGPEIGVASTKAFTTQLVGAVPAGGEAGAAARDARRRAGAGAPHRSSPRSRSWWRRRSSARPR